MRKKVLIALGILIGVFAIVGLSYAYWMLSFKQTDNNILSAMIAYDSSFSTCNMYLSCPANKPIDVSWADWDLDYGCEWED